jgi:hydrogenase/urease accessory protein HupE
MRFAFLRSLGLGIFLCMLGIFGAPTMAAAHEVRPAYLEITETAPNRYQMLWRVPVLNGMPLPVVVALPKDARNVGMATAQDLRGSRLERRIIEVANGLAGRRIDLVGLEATITDVLVRFQPLDGGYSTSLVHPSKPRIEIPANSSMMGVATGYLAQGVSHILAGVDHLLFILGLLLLVQNRWMLVKTITAFTIAHSITLALVTLGFVSIPIAPVQASIALSILFVAVEVMRARRGETSFAARWPWAVAFAFGLLHGICFAGGLSLTGLPHGDIPLALLMFNIGVEIGQLAFVALVLILERALRLLEVRWPTELEAAPVYLIGICGAYWTIERVFTMVTGV